MTIEEIAASAAATDSGTAAEEVVMTEEEAFNAAFDEATTVLSDDNDDVGDTTDATDAKGAATDDTGDDKSGDVGSDDDAGGASTDGSSGSASDAAATREADAPTARELALQARLDALEASAQSTQTVVEPEPVVETPQPTLTAEETAKITAYREEWGDVAEAEALIRREENQVLVGYMFSQIRDVLAPLLAAHETRNGRDQYTDLVSLVPDYDEVRDKAVSWVETLPEGINKRIFTEVVKTGTPAEVAEMINSFKKATSYASSTPSAASTSAATPGGESAVQKPTGEGAAAKPTGKAAAALRVVKTVRSKTNTGGVDVNDFDSAFDEFAQKK